MVFQTLLFWLFLSIPAIILIVLFFIYRFLFSLLLNIIDDLNQPEKIIEIKKMNNYTNFITTEKMKIKKEGFIWKYPCVRIILKVFLYLIIFLLIIIPIIILYYVFILFGSRGFYIILGIIISFGFLFLLKIVLFG